MSTPTAREILKLTLFPTSENLVNLYMMFKDSDDMTTFAAALKFFKKEVIDAPTNLNFRQPILQYAAFNGKIKIVECLLDAGADPNAVDKDIDTALHRQLDRNDIFDILIKRGANVNARNKDGETPLHKVVCNKKSGFASTLLLNGADQSIKDNDGRTPLDYANRYGLSEMIAILENASKPKSTPTLCTTGCIGLDLGRIASSNETQKQEEEEKQQSLLLYSLVVSWPHLSIEERHEIMRRATDGDLIKLRNALGEKF